MRWVRLSALPDGKAFNKNRPKSLDWQIRDGGVWFQGRKRIHAADPESFEFLDDEESFLARDSKHVFHGPSKVTAIDVATFEPLGDRYYRDKQLVYLEHETSIRPLKGRDVKHFVVLGNGYARDSVHGYYWGSPIRKCKQPLTLELLADDQSTADLYARDVEHIYFESAALPGADVASWTLLPDGFSRDEKRIYFGASKLPRVHAETWQHIKGAFSKDERTVYSMQFPIQGADPESFRVKANGRACDKHGEFDGYGERV